MHYGLLPRANRGIFAINELPDLAGKIQVGLFNILQEGDVQIKGYPIRLQLDVHAGVHRQPRGLHGARQDHHAAQGPHRLRDPHALSRRRASNAMAITAQEAWTDRAGGLRGSTIPAYVREVVEEVAFQARADRKIDKRSGVSQRLPITTLEIVVSNAERRALANGETRRRAARHRHLRRAAVDHRQVRARVRGRAARRRAGRARADPRRPSATSSPACSTASTRAHGRRVVRPGRLAAARATRTLGRRGRSRRRAACRGCASSPTQAGLAPGAPAPAVASAIDFVLEGLYAQKKISRSDERGYTAGDERRRRAASGPARGADARRRDPDPAAARRSTTTETTRGARRSSSVGTSCEIPLHEVHRRPARRARSRGSGLEAVRPAAVERVRQSRTTHGRGRADDAGAARRDPRRAVQRRRAARGDASSSCSATRPTAIRTTRVSKLEELIQQIIERMAEEGYITTPPDLERRARAARGQRRRLGADSRR